MPICFIKEVSMLRGISATTTAGGRLCFKVQQTLITLSPMPSGGTVNVFAMELIAFEGREYCS